MKKRKKKSAANASGMKTIKRNIMNDKAGHTIFSLYRIFIRRDYSRNISRGGSNSKME